MIYQKSDIGHLLNTDKKRLYYDDDKKMDGFSLSNLHVRGV